MHAESSSLAAPGTAAPHCLPVPGTALIPVAPMCATGGSRTGETTLAYCYRRFLLLEIRATLPPTRLKPWCMVPWNLPELVATLVETLLAACGATAGHNAEIVLL